MRKLRNLAAALVMALVLSAAAIAGDMQGPGYTPPPPPPPPVTQGQGGDMGSPGEPGEDGATADAVQEISTAEAIIIGLLTVLF